MHRCIYGNAIKCAGGNAPNYLKDLLVQVSHVQQRFTRANNDFYVPRGNIKLYKKSLLHNGPRLWNTLPDSLNVLPELRSLNIVLKVYKD